MLTQSRKLWTGFFKIEKLQFQQKIYDKIYNQFLSKKIWDQICFQFKGVMLVTIGT